MIVPGYGKKKAVFLCLLIIVLSVADYLLFPDPEFVWPFFFFPYLVFSVVFLVIFIRSHDRSLFRAALYLLIIIPVFAGLTMSLGWMMSIDFFGEMVRRIMS